MSTNPKKSAAVIEQERQYKLKLERQRQAEEEAKRRAAAAEQARRQRLEALRNQSIAQTQAVTTQVQQQQSSLYSQDSAELQKRCQKLLDILRSSQTESQIQNAVQEIPRIEQDLNQAVSRKRRDDEEKKRKAELEKQEFELQEIERQVSQISPAHATKFDSSGRAALQQAIEIVKSAIARGKPETVRAPLANAIETVQRHANLVAQRLADWLQRQAEAQQALGELRDMIAGLKADVVVMRWHGLSVAELETQAQTAVQAVTAEQFELPGNILAAAKTREQQIVNEANAEQIQADQRDYIAKSIAQTLQDMGFIVSAPEAEYSDHPKTAIILKAATASGKGISVSVPVDGEVWYSVDGYPKSTQAAVGGGNAAVCDEAEQVLTEMHSALESEFGVKMSAISWEGKDPDRELRKADELPNSDSQQSRGGLR